MDYSLHHSEVQWLIFWNKLHKRVPSPRHMADISGNRIVPPLGKTIYHFYQYGLRVKRQDHCLRSCTLYYQLDYNIRPLDNRCTLTSILCNRFFYLCENSELYYRVRKKINYNRIVKIHTLTCNLAMQKICKIY